MILSLNDNIKVKKIPLNGLESSGKVWDTKGLKQMTKL